MYGDFLRHGSRHFEYLRDPEPENRSQVYSSLSKGLNLTGSADRLGLTALSYTLFPRREMYSQKSSSRPHRFEGYLLSQGCNPYRKDVFNLSYDQIARGFYV